ncbi:MULTISPECIES: hypothetical protein [Silvimonas]|uniref:hypothetical protein n=1 Tax=Silvimonas TaxID=300264 RepID=UPI0024B37B89|nr:MULTISPECIES: hypothetical protein [Silvimonas]MDR3426277.1 hypothetical protein [Silvimonas sp.]
MSMLRHFSNPTVHTPPVPERAFEEPDSRAGKIDNLPGTGYWLLRTSHYFEDCAVTFGTDFFVHRKQIVRF